MLRGVNIFLEEAAGFRGDSEVTVTSLACPEAIDQSDQAKRTIRATSVESEEPVEDLEVEVRSSVSFA